MTPKHYNQAQAEHEGWWLSTRDDGTYEIQRYDNAKWRWDRTYAQLEPPFKSDEEAEAYVRWQQFSPMHAEAIAFNGKRWR